MVPNPAALSPVEQINAMYQFFAFEDALENGLSADDLVEEQAGRWIDDLKNKMDRIVDELLEKIDLNKQEEKDLIEEIRGLRPEETPTYVEELGQRVTDLTNVVDKHEKANVIAEKIIQELTEENAFLNTAVKKMPSFINGIRQRNGRLVNEVYAAGDALNNHVANPRQTQRNDHAAGRNTTRKPTAGKRWV